MAAPTNTSAGTAIDLGSVLPADATQRVDDAGTTYTVWYKFTAPAPGNLVGVFGFGDLTTYTPRTVIYSDAGVTMIVEASTSFPNRPVQFVVTPGNTYWIELVTNSGNPTPANLTLNVQAGPFLTCPVGSLAVNDDTDGFPLMLVSSTTSHGVKSAVSPFPAGEAGDILPQSGRSLWSDAWNGHLELYAPGFTLLTQVAIDIGFGFAIRANTRLNQFYVGIPGNPVTVKTVDADGAIGGTTYTLTANTTIANVSPSNDGSLLYFANNTQTAPIKRWVTATDTATTDLVAGITNYRVGDILTLTDDSILVLYHLSSAGDFFVKRYSAAGATLNTYATVSTTYPSGTFPRLAYAIDDPASFWVWFHPATGVSTFRNVMVSDGSTISDATYSEYEIGVYQAAATATPTSRFGVSFSCPFVVIRAGVPPGGGDPDEPDGPGGGGDVIPSFNTSEEIIRRLRRAPHISGEHLRQFFSRIEFEFERGVGTLTGQGVDPQLMLRWSNDGGKTWSDEVWLTLGAQGQYSTRAFAYRLGSGRDRVFEVTISDPVFVALLDAYLDVDLGTR